MCWLVPPLIILALYSDKTSLKFRLTSNQISSEITLQIIYLHTTRECNAFKMTSALLMILTFDILAKFILMNHLEYRWGGLLGCLCSVAAIGVVRYHQNM